MSGFLQWQTCSLEIIGPGAIKNIKDNFKDHREESESEIWAEMDDANVKMNSV